MNSDYIDYNCGFCTEYNGIVHENNLLTNVILPATGLNSRIVDVTENFFVIPTIGAFVKGYFLIVSKKHYECIGKIPKEHFIELNCLQNAIKEFIKSYYKTGSIQFEHGSVSCTNRFGGCVNHAHLHILPCDRNIISTIEKYGMTSKKILSFDELTEYARKDLPYLFFEDYNCQKYIIKGDIIPSQFFRMILAQHHGCLEKWDWRQHFFLDNMVETVCDFKKNMRG